MNMNITKYDLPSDAYLGFDAQNLKDLIIQKLNKGGVFTDQEYEGSNFSAVIDVIAYTYHLLLFYLNRMGAESTFTQTQLYENMNRIVKLLGYNPIGYQTSCVSFEVNAPVGDNKFELNTTYILPRYAYINVNGIKYTLTDDILFAFTENDEIVDNNHVLEEFGSNNILFQGEVVEAQPYVALGESFEVYTLIPANNSLINQQTIVDFSNFGVFVYDSASNTWQEWTETSSLYLENNSSLKYEKRLNESGYYEFRFGNNVNGKQLNAGDIVQIYYLRSDGISGEIGINQLNGNTLNLFHTPTFNSIINNTLLKSGNISISDDEAKLLNFTNSVVSTKFTTPETVETIRKNTSKVFKSQSQLITANDIQTHIERNFNNIASSVCVMDNNTYINSVMAYYYNLGVDSITKDSRIALNQAKFSTSCNFNNIYVYLVPKYSPVTSENVGCYVDSNLKQYIVTKLNALKPLTTEIIPMDPVYMAVGFGIRSPQDTIFTNAYSTQTPDTIINDTKLVITRFANSYNKPSLIKSQVIDIIKNVFEQSKLGYTVSTIDLVNNILSIEGVKNITTERNGNVVNGVSLMVWNPIYYNKDISITTNSINFNTFKYPFFYNIAKLENYIDIRIGD